MTQKELNQRRNSEKAALAEIMRQHGIEWEQLGTQNEHLTVQNFKKQECTPEVKALGNPSANSNKNRWIYRLWIR